MIEIQRNLTPDSPKYANLRPYHRPKNGMINMLNIVSNCRRFSSHSSWIMAASSSESYPESDDADDEADEREGYDDDEACRWGWDEDDG